MQVFRTVIKRAGRSPDRVSYITMALLISTAFAYSAKANNITPPLNQFVLSSTNADTSMGDGSVVVSADDLSFILTGGNDGSGIEGITQFTFSALTGGVVQFQYSYSSIDTPGFDSAGYLLGNNQFQLTDTDTAGIVASSSFTVSAGQVYGWWVDTADNTGGPGVLNVSLVVATAPEPTGFALGLIGVALTATIRWRVASARARKEKTV
jgi:hypothetical protein